MITHVAVGVLVAHGDACRLPFLEPEGAQFVQKLHRHGSLLLIDGELGDAVVSRDSVTAVIAVLSTLERAARGDFRLLFGSGLHENAPMDAIKLTLVALAGWMNRQQQDVIDYLQEEIRILKEQRGRRRPKFTDEQRTHLARKAKRIKFGRLKEIANLVTPQTLLAWHRRLIAKKYDSSGVRRKAGRPPTKEELRQLVIRVAGENRTWGYTRLRGALGNLGHEIGRGAIADILRGQVWSQLRSGRGRPHGRSF